MNGCAGVPVPLGRWAGGSAVPQCWTHLADGGCRPVGNNVGEVAGKSGSTRSTVAKTTVREPRQQTYALTPALPRSCKSALASCKSLVSNPSVNRLSDRFQEPSGLCPACPAAATADLRLSSRAKFPGFGLLAMGNGQALLQQASACAASETACCHEQFPLQPMQLCCVIPLPVAVHCGQYLGEDPQSLCRLPGVPIRLRPAWPYRSGRRLFAPKVCGNHALAQLHYPLRMLSLRGKRPSP